MLKNYIQKRYLPGCALLVLFYAAYYYVGKGGSIFIYENQAEMGLYFMTSGYVAHLWGSLPGALSGDGSILEWLYNFIFHFSPSGFTEKPFYSFLLGYFRLPLMVVGLGGPGSDSVFNHILTLTLAFGTYIWFARRELGAAGFTFAAFIISLPLFTMLEGNGYHTIPGVALYFVSVAFMCSEKRRLFAEGVFLALAFFTSQHMAVFVAVTFVGRISWISLVERNVRTAGVYLCAFALPFALFLLRDLAYTAWPLDLLAPVGLAEYAAGFGRGNPLVYDAFFESKRLAVGQGLPFHPTYIFDLLGILYPRVHYLFYLVLPGVFIALKGAEFLRTRGPGSGAGASFDLLERGVCLMGAVLLVALVVHALYGAVVIARAFTPYVVIFFLLESMLLLWVSRRFVRSVGGARTLGMAAAAALSVLFLAFNVSFASSIVSMKGKLSAYRDSGVAEPVVGRVDLLPVGASFADFRDFLMDLKAGGRERLVVPPLILLSKHSRYYNEGMLCSLYLLEEGGAAAGKAKEVLTEDEARALAIQINEHQFYRYYKKSVTGSGDFGRLDMALSERFSFRNEYGYDVDSLLGVLAGAKAELMKLTPCLVIIYEMNRSRGA